MKNEEKQLLEVYRMMMPYNKKCLLSLALYTRAAQETTLSDLVNSNSIKQGKKGICIRKKRYTNPSR